MRPPPTWGARAATLLGFALLALVGFVYLVSGLVVPAPWLLVVWAVWVASAAFAVHNRHRPGIVLAVPVVAMVLWVAILSAGGAFLDWSA